MLIFELSNIIVYIMTTLQYWLCERTNIIEQETQLSTVPRILKWNLPKLKKKLEGIQSLDNLRNVQVKLLNDYILFSSLPSLLITILLSFGSVQFVIWL